MDNDEVGRFFWNTAYMIPFVRMGTNFDVRMSTADWLKVLADLMGDQSLAKFRSEYEKLHKALQKTHESEKRLMQKCRELNAEIVANSAKVSTALKLSQDDQTTINNLKKVLLLSSSNLLKQTACTSLTPECMSELEVHR